MQALNIAALAAEVAPPQRESQVRAGRQPFLPPHA
jgi:hypothetical protein